MTLRANVGDSNFDSIFAEFLDLKRETSGNVDLEVSSIVNQVRKNGDDALAEFTKKFDRYDVNLNQLRFTEDEIAKTIRSCKSNHLDALNLAAHRIKIFHQKQLPENLDYLDEEGVRLGYRWTPIHEVGIYIPGGTASYPSSVLMSARQDCKSSAPCHGCAYTWRRG